MSRAGAPPVDPGVRRDLNSIPAVRELTAESLPAIRAARPPRPQLSGEVEHSDLTIPGDPALRLRIHRRRAATGVLPCILSIHGGGFVLGDATVDDALFENWCRRFDCIGVSVDYRLAPETPYPGPLDDCHRGLRWVRDHSTELGIDPARVGVFGVSAGGGLAAGLSLLIRDLGEPPPAFQALLYPMLDDRQVTTSSRWTDVPRWNPVANRFGWRSYLGPVYGAADVPYHAAPARATDLTGLPPTCVVVGTVDGFHDEDVAFAQRLCHAGVSTELHVYAGGSHGFAAPACRAPLAIRARQVIDDWLAGQLGLNREEELS
ncbi:alpha/beta hydrolase [Amycolatopsis pithecellobii]|uniref:alpha/beta hydrolase n=1 Tax=Amycolatopsis pithecellobii TaxID=664692 RepID=UPI0014089D6D|nr:alpha/beta hydrolase [Amycolatopsis pithecellobii]